MNEVASDGPAIPVVQGRVVSASVPTSHAVNNLGYRPWSNQLSPGWMRWSVITEVGVKRSWQSPWLRRMLFFAWAPALLFGAAFFAWEQAALYQEWRQPLIHLLGLLPPTEEFHGIRDAVLSGNLDTGRHAVWAWLLQTFFRYPQGVLMLMVVGVISPQLISQDIRSRAFLLYFSRPLTRAEYLFGKLACLWTYLLIISTVPALVLYLLGILLSPNLQVIAATWDLPFRILAASIVLMVPTSALALCFSSMTQESRYAGFAWFAIWILGWFTYATATSADAYTASHEAFSNQRFHPHRFEETRQSPWTHLSLYHTLGRVQSWIFGFARIQDVATSAAILVAVTLASLAILFRNISAPMRV